MKEDALIIINIWLPWSLILTIICIKLRILLHQS